MRHNLFAAIVVGGLMIAGAASAQMVHYSATLKGAEGVAPVLFRDWARGGEVYDCADHGCDCGWGWIYEEGEPIGMAWPTPLIQITAVSEESTDNTYDALRPMIDEGPLHKLIPKTGEEFIRLPNKGRMVPTTDADFTLVDLKKRWRFDAAKAFTRSRANMKLWDGFALTGSVHTTIVRGVPVYREGQIVGPAGHGRFQRPNLSIEGGRPIEGALWGAGPL